MLEPATIRDDRRAGAHLNVGAAERGASLAAGAGLLLLGLRSRRLGPSSLALGAAGLALALRGLTGRCAVYRSLGIRAAGEPLRREIEWVRSVTIGAPPARVRDFLSDPASWGSAAGVVREATALAPDRFRLRLALPGRLGAEYELARRPDGMSYESGAGAPVPHEIELELTPAPHDRGTQLRCRVTLRPPGGAAGAALGHWLEGLGGRALGQQLQQVKQCIETGERASTSLQPSARREPARSLGGTLLRAAARLP
jgi:uncharacterized membrane protein